MLPLGFLPTHPTVAARIQRLPLPDCADALAHDVLLCCGIYSSSVA